jgi:hypothetical protein
MRKRKPGQTDATPSSKPDDLIKPKSEDGKTELSEQELGDVSGGVQFTFKLVSVKTIP